MKTGQPLPSGRGSEAPVNVDDRHVPSRDRKGAKRNR